MLNVLWPKRLPTPKIDLPSPIDEGLRILSMLDGEIVEENEEEHSYRVQTPEFSMACYESDGLVSAVWYDDAVGRLLNKGREMKLRLYLARYGEPKDWDLRKDNGWMRYYFNDVNGLNLVYGMHNDVIRVNAKPHA